MAVDAAAGVVCGLMYADGEDDLLGFRAVMVYPAQRPEGSGDCAFAQVVLKCHIHVFALAIYSSQYGLSYQMSAALGAAGAATYKHRDCPAQQNVAVTSCH